MTRRRESFAGGMRLRAGVVSRKEAMGISPLYVAYAEGDFDKWEAVNSEFEKLKAGSRALTFVDGKFFMVRVTSVINHPGLDGPVVRVSNVEYSWRVDGDKYAYPVSKEQWMCWEKGRGRGRKVWLS